MTFQDKVIYQIYPKSFYDSDGDGIGDLRGIIAKISYLKKLNIDMIWFNPFFVSPQNDNGYDIADYYKVDPTFGTMADFEELAAKLKEAHIGIMLDMVLNHTSTDHEWFQKALAGDKKYQAFYYLRDPKPNGDLPTNWESKFGGPAWGKFGNTGKYYLHLYDPTQADLDWHNPEVRQELYKVINFWRAKGVHGFRFDVINVTGKETKLVDAPTDVASKTLYTDTPVVQDYLKEMNTASFGQDPDAITVGEMSSTSIANSVQYTLPANHELTMVFTFHHLKVDYANGEKWTKAPFDFMKLKQILNDWQIGMAKGGGWNALFWNNHDQPRALNRFGDPVHYRAKSAEMLATTMHLLRGTPYIYMGEEIGMSDPDYTSMADYVDIECKNAYKELLAAGKSATEAFEIVKTKSRDNSRTPMQWDNSEYAGFSTHKPWLMPTNQAEVNVKDELVTGEIFAYYQKLIKLRKTQPIISLGDFKPLLENDPQVFAYLRDYKGQTLVVLNNFYGKSTTVQLPDSLANRSGKILISNYPEQTTVGPKIELKPYQSTALLLN
ncbi:MULTISPECIES: alpha,alpha-phosphotrehalase [Pediococcus]|jgi:trehalose-6-phosphate hydrolase|uniref:Alpha,alpha-phosphotrehalase n=1 Tax=Pediococcus parvulus TaxID=54062 RepID=A0ABX2UGT0_9LACO|nr:MULTISPECIES: alpha,alpha-phosphotrehalase [Pediococcus]MCT3027668.1 alpha,alpha-phosphotrehalase [Pediococcus parvulus]MCT3028216.1 alpha,alpha-phosphotrehalase [Pediococcus parvulus]MCT3031136.1 alpha,alpha-phosphotrehalase [Pediococcus parvulus]MDN5575444.1 alpha,alpha-phosphotrehalase [Pediococcus sp.]OAD63985.1 alpha,alpha-phosphotrehalase [Pediococcus parvulus]